MRTLSFFMGKRGKFRLGRLFMSKNGQNDGGGSHVIGFSLYLYGDVD
jgi:hypothetical protein